MKDAATSPGCTRQVMNTTGLWFVYYSMVF